MKGYMEKTRTEHSVRNTTAAVISRLLAILMGFAVRVVFTHILSASYVGVCGLFSNMITVLALPELDIVTAIPYALYDPIARGNKNKQKSLMKLYRKFYNVTSGIILFFGAACIPLLEPLTGNQKVEHLTLIYLMYLFNSALSYLWVYKRTLIDAHQLISVGVWYQTVFLVFQDIVQIVVLCVTRNFVLFLSVSLICTFARNIAISRKADSLYPYLKEKDVKPLPKEEKKEILSNMRAMVLHKVGNVVVNNTDNLLLSSLIGLSSVGSYFNYYLIIGSIRQILNQVLQGITASVGNLGVSAGRTRIREILEDALFVGQWIFGFSAICIFEFINPFIEVSFGRQYVFPLSVVLVLCLKFYFTGMRQAVIVFRDAFGLFRLDRYKVVLETMLNLGISMALVFRLGTLGIFLGTLISMLLTSVWIEPFVLYKYIGIPLTKYFARYLVYTGIVGVTGLVIHKLCMGHGFFGKLMICFWGINLLWLFLYGRIREFRELCVRGHRILFKNKKMKLKKENCCGCQACADVCPVNAIHMYVDGEGFWYPETENSICTGCGLCEQVCPVKDSSRNKEEELYLGVQAKDDAIRHTSSSGGMFSLLAHAVLEKQGVVYGAGYDGSMEVLHKKAEDIKQLETIKRTKYVQSDLKGIYREIQEELKKDCWVLFCGTPCQAHALKLFLNGKDEKLLLVDLVCYGVGSPGIWRDYVTYLEHRYKGKLQNFSFRDKRNRDSGQMRSFVIEDREVVNALYRDAYCRSYFRNYSIRPSCYHCGFCEVERSSDFTIGDFWGVKNVRPDFDDGMGISLVIAHTEKAKAFWKEIEKNARWFACEKKDILQPRLKEPVKAAKHRRLFMELYQRLPFSMFVKLLGGK